MGDVKTGLIIGGSLELIWMGMVPLAGAQPPNVVIGGIIGTSIAILGKLDPQAANWYCCSFCCCSTSRNNTIVYSIFSYNA